MEKCLGGDIGGGEHVYTLSIKYFEALLISINEDNY